MMRWRPAAFHWEARLRRSMWGMPRPAVNGSQQKGSAADHALIRRRANELAFRLSEPVVARNPGVASHHVDACFSPRRRPRHPKQRAGARPARARPHRTTRFGRRGGAATGLAVGSDRVREAELVVLGLAKPWPPGSATELRTQVSAVALNGVA